MDILEKIKMSYPFQQTILFSRLSSQEASQLVPTDGGDEET